MSGLAHARGAASPQAEAGTSSPHRDRPEVRHISADTEPQSRTSPTRAGSSSRSRTTTHVLAFLGVLLRPFGQISLTLLMCAPGPRRAHASRGPGTALPGAHAPGRLWTVLLVRRRGGVVGLDRLRIGAADGDLDAVRRGLDGLREADV